MTDTPSLLDPTQNDHALLSSVLQSMSQKMYGQTAASLLPDFRGPDDPGAQAPVAPTAQPATSGDVTVGMKGSVADLMRAMAGGVESHGDPNATNPRTGAHGAWQIMPSNWPSWAKDAGVDPTDRSLTAQVQVTAHKMQEYLDSLGSIDAVAVAWYGGPGAAKAWLKNPNAPRFNKAPAPGEPTINEYVNKIRAAMGASNG